MQNSSSSSRPAQGLVFTAELFVDRSASPQWVEVVISLKGRESTCRRRWEAPTGRLSAPQLMDLSSWLAMSVENAILTLSGVQGVLPLT